MAVIHDIIIIVAIVIIVMITMVIVTKRIVVGVDDGHGIIGIVTILFMMAVISIINVSMAVNTIFSVIIQNCCTGCIFYCELEFLDMKDQFLILVAFFFLSQVFVLQMHASTS